MRNKVGKISITGAILNKPDILKVLYSQFLPYKIVESDVYPKNFLFLVFGYCDNFDEINEGDKIPEYEATFSGNTITFEKLPTQ